MIKTQNLTPQIYSKKSRDFQFISKLFDLVLNDARTNSDVLATTVIGSSSNSDLLSLLAYTLNFNPKHNYSVKQLSAILGTFSKAMKNKGTLYSIELLVNTILHAEGILNTATIEFTDNILKINLPPTLSNTLLLRDLLEYVIPAGTSFVITKQINKNQEATTNLQYNAVIDTFAMKQEKNILVIGQDSDYIKNRVGYMGTIIANSTIYASKEGETTNEN